MKNVQHRNVGIDILKFFAVILVTNSHMDLLYGRWSILATGVAIGDALFFFCSGFTLFLGQKRRFDNYYQKTDTFNYTTSTYDETSKAVVPKDEKFTIEQIIKRISDIEKTVVTQHQKLLDSSDHSMIL